MAFNLVCYFQVQFHAWDPPLNPGTHNLRLSMLHPTPVEPQLGPSASRERVSNSQCNLKALISDSLTFLCNDKKVSINILTFSSLEGFELAVFGALGNVFDRYTQPC